MLCTYLYISGKYFSIGHFATFRVDLEAANGDPEQPGF